MKRREEEKSNEKREQSRKERKAMFHAFQSSFTYIILLNAFNYLVTFVFLFSLKNVIINAQKL